MKNLFISICIVVVSLLSISFLSDKSRFDNNNHSKLDNAKWYICASCCKTKKANQTPTEQGCRVSSSGTHNYWFVGVAGDYNYTCRNCDAEVYLTSSTSPNATKCCSGGGTHTWYHK